MTVFVIPMFLEQNKLKKLEQEKRDVIMKKEEALNKLQREVCD